MRRRLGAHSGLSVYVASPLGFAESTMTFLYKELIPAIEASGIRPVNPWDAPGEINQKTAAVKKMRDLRKRRAAWMQVVQLLGRTNTQAIEDADGMVAVLDGVDVDSGTAAEIGYAAAQGKWIIGYRSDSRRTGEDQTAEVNLQVEYFISRHRGTIVHSLAELQKELEARNKRGR